jgi:hypothetical protein
VGPTHSPLWQIEGDSNPKNYVPAQDGQCTDFTFLTDSSIYFPFKRTTTSCYRDQINPLSSPGVLYYLNLGQTYTWKFQTKINSDSSSILWQIHTESWVPGCNDTTPPVGLVFDDTVSRPRWYIFVDYPPSFGHEYNVYPFRENTVDTWKIQARMATSGGFVEAWHNGTRFVNATGIKYPGSCKNPFWNLGPYPSQWERASSPGTHIDATFNYMQLYTP